MSNKILKPFSVVRLKTDDYKQKTQVGKGSLGTIVEVYGDNAYEVDFDTTFFSVKQDEVELSNFTNSTSTLGELNIRYKKSAPSIATKVLASPLSGKHLKARG